MKNKELVFIGGGGFSHEILEVAEQSGYDVVGYFDDKKTNLNLEYLGNLEDYYLNAGVYKSVFLTIGSTNKKTSDFRRNIISYLLSIEVELPSLVSQHAIVSESATLGKGVFVAHGCVLSVDVSVGNFCIINFNSVIGHHSTLSINVNVNPMVFIAGNVTICENVVLGAASKILQGVVMGKHCIVGIGSTVLTNLKDSSTVWPMLDKITTS